MASISKIAFLILFLILYSFAQESTYGDSYSKSDVKKKIYGNKASTDTVSKRGLWKVVHGSFAFDTTALKSNSEGIYCYLAGLSASNRNGGGWFIEIDSTFSEGIVAFNHPINGKQWARLSHIQEMPYNAGEYGVVPDDTSYAESNTKIINKLLEIAGAGDANLRGKVILPPGWIYLKRPTGKKYIISVPKNVAIEGMGTGTQRSGTILKLIDNQVASGDTVSMIVNDVAATWLETGTINEWWHNASISNLSIDCNGDNQSGVVSGITILRAGETSFLDNINISGYVGWGIRVKSSSAPPLRIVSTTVNPATSADTTLDYSISERKGFWLDGGGAINGINLSGDNNIPLLYVGSGGNGATSVHCIINGLKFEAFGTGSANSVPAVLDSLNSVNSTVIINGLTADKSGSYSIYDGDVILIRSGKPQVYVKTLQTTGFKNIMKWVDSPTPGETDSVRSLNHSDVSAMQEGSVLNYGAGLYYLPQKVLIEYKSGFYYQNHLGEWVKSMFFSTDQYLHIVSPKDYILMERSDGTDQFLFGATKNTSFLPIELDSTYLTVGEGTIPGTPSTGKSHLYLTKDGAGNYLLLIKFSNGDVDTLATSASP